MMSDAVLQILLLLAYLAIGLIAVTFPIYAICVTFLPQEKWESEKERKKRIDKLRAKISELTSELEGEQRDSGRVAQLREQLGRYEIELKGTELRVDCLRAKGAVRLPVTYLALALLTAGLGIYSFELESLGGVIFFGFISTLGSAMAIHRLYKTISAVEFAALRPAQTVEFNIKFEGNKTKQQVKLGETSTLFVSVWSDEQDVENLTTYSSFPSQFEIPEVLERELNITNFPDATWVVLEVAFLPKGGKAGFRVPITPKKVGEYPIPVSIKARGIYESKKELIVKVVK